jgi:hypothetical protein
MLSFLKKIELKFLNRFVGVDIFLDNNKLQFSYLVIKRNGDTIHIEDSGENLTDFNQLKEKGLHKLPILVSVNGRGIIHKKHFADSLEASEIKILSQVIPGFDASKLYFQILTTGSNKELCISAIRKELLDDVIENLKDLGFYTTEILLGPYSVLNLGTLLTDSQIVSSNYTFTLDNSLKIDLQVSDNVSIHKIGEDSISGNLVSAFGVIAGNLISKSEITGNIDELLTKSREEFTYFFLFRRFAFITLVFIFSLLLVNYLVFSHYNSKMSEAGSILRQNKESVEMITDLSAEISKKETFLTGNNLLYNTRISYYADCVASLVPAKMTLSELLIFPPKSDLKDKTEILYEQNKIIIRGKTSPTDLDTFISELSNEIWVEDTDITDYKSITGTDMISFTVELIIKRK